MKRLLFVCIALIVVLAACGGGVEKSEKVETTEKTPTLEELYIKAAGDLKGLGTSVESYMTDNFMSPDVAAIDELAKHVEGLHIRVMPIKDPWGNNYFYKKTGHDTYAFGCAGSDGKFLGFDQSGRYDDKKDQDIVFKDGTFSYIANLK